jgi:hypothetical protein
MTRELNGEEWGETLILRLDRVFDMDKGSEVCAQFVWDTPGGREHTLWLPGLISHHTTAAWLRDALEGWLISGASSTRSWAVGRACTVRRH